MQVDLASLLVPHKEDVRVVIPKAGVLLLDESDLSDHKCDPFLAAYTSIFGSSANKRQESLSTGQRERQRRNPQENDKEIKAESLPPMRADVWGDIYDLPNIRRLQL